MEKYSLPIKLLLAAIAAGGLIYFGMDPTAIVTSITGAITPTAVPTVAPHGMLGLF